MVTENSNFPNDWSICPDTILKILEFVFFTFFICSLFSRLNNMSLDTKIAAEPLSTKAWNSFQRF